MKSFSPLWRKTPEKLLEEMINTGFEIMIVSVSAEGIGKEFLGRIIDKECINDLKKLSKKYGIHPAFEGGEAETFVLNCPLFKKGLKVNKTKTIWDKKTNSGYMLITI